MANREPVRADLRIIDRTASPVIDSYDGEGGGTTWYCRACGEIVGHADSGRTLTGLVPYTAKHKHGRKMITRGSR